MKKNIVILGSTGSIGQNTLNIIKKDKKNFDIKLLSTNKNVSEIIRQAKEFKVKNIIINDYDEFIKAKFKNKYKNITIFNKFKDIEDVGVFEFDRDDIVRNPLISKILKKYEDE